MLTLIFRVLPDPMQEPHIETIHPISNDNDYILELNNLA